MSSRPLLPVLAGAALWAVTIAGLPAPAAAATGIAAEVAGDTITEKETYERSADIMVRDAESLDDTDPLKSKKLRMAGRLYRHAGLLEKARLTTIHAGIAAYHAGEAALAAHIFLDASETSLERGVPHAAESAADRAGWVLRNGKLTAEERESVLRRVRYLDDEGIDWDGAGDDDMASEDDGDGASDGGGR